MIIVILAIMTLKIMVDVSNNDFEIFVSSRIQMPCSNFQSTEEMGNFQ